MRGIIMALTVARFALAATAGSITYTYDAQHRLVQASFGDSNKVFYAYDAAGNVDQHTVITDAKYLQSWLWYISMVDGPLCMPQLSRLLSEQTVPTIRKT